MSLASICEYTTHLMQHEPIANTILHQISRHFVTFCSIRATLHAIGVTPAQCGSDNRTRNEEKMSFSMLKFAKFKINYGSSPFPQCGLPQDMSV